MTQSPPDPRATAVEHLLGLIFWHLEMHPGAMQVRQYGQSDGTQEPTQPKAYNLDCDGRCVKCLDTHRAMQKRPACPPEIPWVMVGDQLRRRFPLDAIWDCLETLGNMDARLLWAVWYKHVEPWADPKTEPLNPAIRARRDVWARLGVDWIAGELPGDIPDPEMSKTERITIQLQAKVPPKVIAAREECSPSYVRRLKRNIGKVGA